MDFFKPPGEISFSNGNVFDNWKKWVQKFQNFMLASEKNQKSDDVKIAIMLNLMGDEGLEIYSTFKQHRDLGNPEKFEDVMQYFTMHCASQQNLVESAARQKRKADFRDRLYPKKLLKFREPSVEIRFKDVISPLWNGPYEEQLKRKQTDVREFLIKQSKRMEHANDRSINFTNLLYYEREKNSGQCCVLNEILPSPVTTRYSTKCTFNCGRHSLTGETTVGFYQDMSDEGWMYVGEPDDYINIREPVLRAAKSFQAYIQESQLDVYNYKEDAGYWRELVIRTSNISTDLMLIVVIHPQTLPKKKLSEEKTKLKKYFEEGVGSTVGVTSLYLKFFNKIAPRKEKLSFTRLMGQKFFEESLLGLKFQVNPYSFFHSNIPAAEVLYKLLLKLVNPRSTVLNLNCSNGTISLCLAKAGIKVFGIDALNDNIGEARLRARQANIHNVDFVCGRAEDKIFPTLRKLNSSNVVAVAEFPVSKLNKDAIQAIRAAKQISQVFFLTSSLIAASDSLHYLCHGKLVGDAFYPVRADVVDIGPNTPEKELVMVFKRSSDINLFNNNTQGAKTEHLEEAASMHTSETELESSHGRRWYGTCSELVAKISGAERFGGTSSETMEHSDGTCKKEPSDAGIEAQLSGEVQSEMADHGNIIVKKEPLCEQENDSAQLTGKVVSEMADHGNVTVKKEPL